MRPAFRWGVAAVVAVAAAVTARADLAAANAEYGRLLTRYVTARGVKYDAWRTDGDDLKKMAEISTVYRSEDPHQLPLPERKALYINLYNAKVLELVLFGNPKRSITELSKAPRDFEIFSRPTVNFGGKPVSLNDLEKRLREEFKDPRVHFALNCASRSCPALRTEPYDAARLDEQLDGAARAFLASPAGLTVTSDGGRTRLAASKIFDWYADDFKAAGGVQAFLGKYGPPEAAQAIADGRAKLEFADYDWGLNAAR